MPQRTPSPDEWERTIRTMEKVKLLLQSIPRKAELNDSLSRMVDELEEAERLLGFDPAVDGHLDLRQG